MVPVAGSGISGRCFGVYSPGTASGLLHHYMGEGYGTVGAWGFNRGGMGGGTQAMARALTEAGGEIRSGAAVERILSVNGKVTGVMLDNGDEIEAPTVISNLDVRRTFLKHVDAAELPGDFVKAVKRFKIRGSSAKLNIALDGFPSFPAAPPGAPFLHGDLHASESLPELERAYDAWTFGRWSSEPY